MKILFVTPEAVPFAKTGGLADVTGALAKELSSIGHDVRIIMPRYYIIDKDHWKLKKHDAPLGVPLGRIGTCWAAVYEGFIPDSNVKVYFIEYEHFFGRKGLYFDETGNGFLDNDNRFAFLSRAAMELSLYLDFIPHVIHSHDWQSAAVPVFLNTVYAETPLARCASLFTIHNMQHQGDFYEGLMDVLEVSWDHFHPQGLEKNGKVNLLKGGIYHSTLVNTVSPSYAEEIKTPEFGWGLEGVIRDRGADLYGIINGIDYDIWNPETDKLIAANFSSDNLEGKDVCKADLQRAMGLSLRPHVPVIGIVTRLVFQKGIDLLATIIDKLLEDMDIQIVLLGTGEVWSHFYFSDAAERHPGKLGVFIGYNDQLAHKIEAGSDFFLMPSRFEPCGLNQLYSFSYGTLPIVSARGGLNDTVINLDERTGQGTGFKMFDLTPEALYNTIGWAVHHYYNSPELIRKMKQRVMKLRFSWEESAREYQSLYYEAVKRRIGERLFFQEFPCFTN
ncbi:MAG: glycogen synthase GlgA [Spirochaetales bacterium]|nr:glycogen synthase GlgA [Spirochaetales bacterium]